MMTFNRFAVGVASLLLWLVVVHPRSAESDGVGIPMQVAELRAQVAELHQKIDTLERIIAAESAARSAADDQLQSQIDRGLAIPQNLLDLANYVSVDPNPINSLSGPHVIFTGANVHIRSGLGSTNGDPNNPEAPVTQPSAVATNGLGNLIVGYNENLQRPVPQPRTGSHNVVIGPGHGYDSFGGFVAGWGNAVLGASASVNGGAGNTASGLQASIGGGGSNRASGTHSFVAGGTGNRAIGLVSTVSGGGGNTASGTASSVSGGSSSTASGTASSVSGGISNTASGSFSTVSGGSQNTAATTNSHVP